MTNKKNKAWEQYQNGLAWQKGMKFTSEFPTFVRFKEGEQWPAPTERTRNMPRPVFNIVDMFVRTKRAAVLNQPITINYTPSEISADDITRELCAQGASDLTDYTKQLWKRSRQDIINAEVVDDAATLGTGIYHCWYDLSVTGGIDSTWRGEIRGESIDPLNFFVANPQIRDIQRQEWLIISQRVRVDDAKKLAEKYGVRKADIQLIQSDNAEQSYDAERKELAGEDKITLLTKYHRDDNGNVVMTRCTESVVICEDIPLTPEGAASPITRYPVAVFNWYLRKKCVFGIGEVQTMIPAQKAVNFLKAMELLSIQQTAWPKLLVKQNALNRQAITNEPGEIITDYTPNGQGITYLNPPVLSGAASALAESIMALMRTTSGVNEATTGESMGASMAASAIIALQAQAKTPIEEVQKRFWLYVEDTGAIWEQMIKTYYTEERALNVDNGTGAGQERRVFLGSAYTGMNYEMTVDVGASSEYGEVLSQTTLDKMLDRGDITIDQYVELAPRNVVPFKEQFKQFREQSGQAAQALMQQAQMMMQQAQAGMPLPVGDEQAQSQEVALPALPESPDGMTRPAGVGGMPLPAIPTAPSIPAMQKGGQ